ncbi:MAG: hypothetical protein H7Y38_14635 [Armatimonadetes bacterium]|nr:hypothetical protein [Armatimonadota bacterium]
MNVAYYRIVTNSVRKIANPFPRDTIESVIEPVFMTFDEATAYLATLREFPPRDAADPRRLHRDCFRELLRRVGSPHEALRCLHVAGTNGKGSTVTFLASALKEAGYRIGAYLSPFVWDVRERWQIGGELISCGELARQVSELRPHVEELARTGAGQITEFELKTVVAFRWFAQEAVDFAVVEVGIGGRLDSTNVIPPPLVSVITSIGWDHQGLLGDTLGKIAGEKAGIIKTGTFACVTGVTEPEPLTVIADVARAQDVPLLTIGDVQVAETRALSLTLRGAFQHRNAACAAAAIRVLRDHGAANINETQLHRGLERATLPGRFEMRSGENGVPVVLDVAHNADAARVLAGALLQEFGVGKRATLVVGMSRGHEPGDFLSALAPLTRHVFATAPTFRPKPAEEIADAARQLNLPVRVTKNVTEALKEAVAEAVKRTDGYVVVTGSFYTVGDTDHIENVLQ